MHLYLVSQLRLALISAGDGISPIRDDNLFGASAVRRKSATKFGRAHETRSPSELVKTFSFSFTVNAQSCDALHPCETVTRYGTQIARLWRTTD